MINLIPTKARKEVVKEYWVRVVTVWLFILSVFGAAVSLFLSPVYVLVTSQVNIYESSAVEKSEKVAEYDLSAPSLAVASRQAQMIVSLRNKFSFSEMVDILESMKGEGVSLNNFDFRRSDLEIGSVKVQGKALTRQDLIDFRDLLLSHPKIKDIYLPISNLAKDKDIPFSISISLAGNGN